MKKETKKKQNKTLRSTINDSIIRMSNVRDFELSLSFLGFICQFSLRLMSTKLGQVF